MHYIFNINKMYCFIFKYRYIIAGVLLLLLIIGGYSGSSIGMWDKYVQPNKLPIYGQPIFGRARGMQNCFIPFCALSVLKEWS